MKMLD
jgi:hypothetical protein